MFIAHARAYLEKPMDEKELMAMIGRKQVAFEQLDNEYSTLLVLLGKVLSGEIRPDEVTVDLEARRWTYTANPISAGSPETPADPQAPDTLQ